jgi:parallel beta-helix repeat protein
MKSCKKIIPVNVLAFLLIITLIPASFNISLPLEVVAVGTVVHVPDDYPTIQDAIGNVTTGDTIIVRSGYTNEGPVTIDKQLTLQGENKYTSVIDGMGNEDAVTIYASGVVFSDLTIHNCTDDGIYVSNSDNTILEDCIIDGNVYDGISIYSSDNFTIKNCEIYNCTYYGVYVSTSNNLTIINSEIYEADSMGIYFNVCQDLLLSNIDLHHNFGGIEVWTSLNVTLKDSNIYNQTGTYDGISIQSTDRVTIYNCDIYNNQVYDTLELDYCDGVNLIDNRVYDNEGRGISLYLCDDCRVIGCEVDNSEWSGLEISGSPYTLIDGCTVHDHEGSSGIYLASSDHTRIKNSQTYRCGDGLYLYDSDKVTVCNSSFYDNSDDGIDSYVSTKLYMSECTFMNNSDEGLEIDYSQGVTVFCNYTENRRGVDAYQSVLDSSFCNFINNSDYGLYADPTTNAIAKNSWWGNATGPYNSVNNSTGTGDRVSDFVEFDPWKTEPAQSRDLISNLRCQVDQLDWMIVYPDRETPKPLGCGAAMVSDWLASAFVTTKLPNYVEGVDTDPSFVDQITGKPLGNTDNGIVTFGGKFVNPIVKRAEDDATPESDRAPVKFHEEAGIFYFQYANGSNIPGAQLPLSVINFDEDMFVIETYTDGDGRLMVICYGFGWQGTYAAGKFFEKVVSPHLALFTDGWVIVHWEETSGDGFVNDPGQGDTYSVVARGI